MVLVAVFLPISYLQGNVGRLFSEFGVAVAAAVVFSALVALTLTPMMTSKLFAGRHPPRPLRHRRGQRLPQAGGQLQLGAALVAAGRAAGAGAVGRPAFRPPPCCRCWWPAGRGAACGCPANSRRARIVAACRSRCRAPRARAWTTPRGSWSGWWRSHAMKWCAATRCA